MNILRFNRCRRVRDTFGFALVIAGLAILQGANGQNVLNVASTAQNLGGFPGTIGAPSMVSIPTWGNPMAWTPSTVHPDWGGNISFTGSGTRSQDPGGTTTFNFSGMTLGYLPAGTWITLGDLDSGSGSAESLLLSATAANNAPLSALWLNAPVHRWGNINPPPVGTIQFAAGTYTLSGGGVPGNPTSSVAFQTRYPIRTMTVQKSGTNVALGFAAPKPDVRPIVCCKEARNLLPNGNFEVWMTGATSGFTLNPSVLPPTVGMGQYKISNGAQVAVIQPGWNIVDETTGSPYMGRFLVARPTPSLTNLWRATVNIPSNQELVFCAKVKPSGPTPAVVELKVIAPNGTVITSSARTFGPLAPPTGWHEHSVSYGSWGIGSVTLEINVSSPAERLLAVDNMASQVKVAQTSPALVNIGIQPSIPASNGDYTISVSNWPTLPSGYSYFWEVENVTDSKKVTNPSNWWGVSQSGFAFAGYSGTNSLSGNSPGKFQAGKKYRITYGVWSKCTRWRSSTWEIGFAMQKTGDGRPSVVRKDEAEQRVPPVILDERDSIRGRSGTQERFSGLLSLLPGGAIQ